MRDSIYKSVSQAEPEETPVEPPPIQSPGLSLDPAVFDRIKSYGSISISRASPPSPIFKRTTKKKSSGNLTAPEVVAPPPPSVEEDVHQILVRYKNLLSDK